MDYTDLEKMRQIEEAKKKVLGSILSKEAYERLSRVRFANPETASQVELYLLQLFQAGKLTKIITDAQMKEILKLFAEKRDFKIKRV